MSDTLNESKLTLILLPGMDGTGELFERFLSVLPAWIQPKVVRYPPRQPLSYSDLLALVQRTLPVSEPFVVLAESFSTPIAIRLAAEGPPNLMALIICAGFIESPIRGIVRLGVSLLAPILFRIPPPGFAIRTLLVGRNASVELVRSARMTISSVSPTFYSEGFGKCCDVTRGSGWLMLQHRFCTSWQIKTISWVVRLSTRLRG
jgi:pimeloyl-[acyl-carrier protein] methyl ester esterase